HVLGTTTPLWTLILAAFYRLGLHDLPAVALVLSALCDGVTAYLLFSATRRLGWARSWSALLVLLLALCPLSAGFTASRMEMSLSTALALGALLSYERPHVCGVLTGLALLVRPEGVLVATIIFVTNVIRSRRLHLTWLLVTAVVVLPWVIYATAVFGSPIPN